MALTEETVQDKIVVAPDADISGESTEVKAICAAVHSQAVKDAYAAHLAEQDT